MQSIPHSPTFKKLAKASHDPLAFFLSLREQQKPCFFLEIAPFIGEAPATTLVGLGPFQKIDNQNLFQNLEHKIASLKTESQQPAFSKGGVFGVLAFEAVADIEPCLQKKGHFHDMSQSELFFAEKLFVFEHASKSITLIDASPRPDLQALENLLTHSPLRKDKQRPDLSDLSLEFRLQARLGFDQFSKAFSQIKKHLLQGDLFQAVLSERFELKTHARAENIFCALRELSPAPYSYFFDFGQRIFLGASPESLVKVNGGHISTHPIAGTRPRSQDLTQNKRQKKNLLRSQKEASEHLMLVDLARNDLGRTARPGTVRVTKSRLVKELSHVMHLVSEVTGEISPDARALHALMSCFPAGTLSGAPKIRALQILSDLEPQARGLFGGAVVAFDGAGGLDSCIAIRSLELQGNLAILRAGAGLVKHSRVHSEYEEIRHKTKLIEQAILHAEALL